MNINRIRNLMIFMFILCSLLLPLSINAASRGISVISDLSHQSGKLGSYRALLIGINDYNDPKIPDLETAVNGYRFKGYIDGLLILDVILPNWASFSGAIGFATWNTSVEIKNIKIKYPNNQ